MTPRLATVLAALTLLTMTMFSAAAPSAASETRIIRFGYLDHPGSALCRLAASKGHFREERLQIELVRFPDSDLGLAALETGVIDIGAFAVGDSLRAIAGGRGFRIIAGGGTPISGNPLAELDDTLQSETEGQGIVVLIPATWPDAGRETIIRLTAGLIRAYRTQLQYPHPVSPPPESRAYDSIHFDPNPDYYRLERVWRMSGLQNVTMKRDYLANHVYEEIYCDALDRLRDSYADEQVFKDLSNKAICTPDCCPASAGKK